MDWDAVTVFAVSVWCTVQRLVVLRIATCSYRVRLVRDSSYLLRPFALRESPSRSFIRLSAESLAGSTISKRALERVLEERECWRDYTCKGQVLQCYSVKINSNFNLTKLKVW